MKLKKIVTNDIKKCHPYQKSYDTDLYYQRLANRLQDTFCSFGNIYDHCNNEVIHRASIILANYMEDIVADSGQWRSFSNLCQELYGHPVPLFHEEEEYYPDEPSMNAIRYLVWSIVTEVSDELVMPDAILMRVMATAAYNILEEVFLDSPVNEELADDIESELQLVSEGFNELREVMMWIYSDCYLTSGEQSEELLVNHMEDMLDFADREDAPYISPDMAHYYARTRSIFEFKIGALALHSKDYLAAMLRTKGMTCQAEEVDKIEMLGMGTYKYERIKPVFGLLGNSQKTNRLKLTRTNGRQIEIEAEELNLPNEDLENFDGLIATSFVFYQGEWHLNGLVFPLSKIAEKWKDLCEDDPENLKPGTKTLTGEMMLERTNGQQIAYFANREQLKDFLEEKFRFSRHMLSFIDEQKGDLPTLFIDKDEPKDCLQFFYGYSPCIADPQNPFYNKEEAKKEVANILWDSDSVTTHAVKYLLEHDYLPDIYNNNVLSRYSTPDEKTHDIDFLLRCYRREDY